VSTRKNDGCVMETKELIQLLLEKLENNDYVNHYREYDRLAFEIYVTAREAQEGSGRP
jgi:hypothetical protein